MKNRYLTKSRFKLGMECPTKLYYEGKSEYANQNIEDQFLLSLAEGGFQVGELAKHYFPGGFQINTEDYEEAIQRTNELLKNDNVIIYEAAVRYENFFIRVDILIKNQDHIEFIEVKAKSVDKKSEDVFYTRSGLLSSSWKPYIYDVAFQKHVITCAFPNYSVSAYLMLVDKSALCPTDGLNQKFKVIKDENGKKHVVSELLSVKDLAEPILVRINADSCCELVYKENIGSMNFKKYVEFLADTYFRDEKIVCPPSSACGNCEYKAAKQEMELGMKSGFHECWKDNLGWTDKDLYEPTILELWNFRNKDICINEGRIKLSDILEEDIYPRRDNKPGISSSERQWLQVQKTVNNDTLYWIDSENLAREMDKWIYPLHFIDFETCMMAIPFNKNRHPYEGIAFQFSHHIVYEDGRIEHHGQYLNNEPGFFPNYDFIRKLKYELELDNGSIFRYAAHENTFLNLIYRQLVEDPDDIPDRDELCQFIRTITQSVKNSTEVWEGSNNMIDMLELVKRYFYDPAMKGSNSIKYVLPAILNNSVFLKEKYSRPIYGAEGGIPSLNYKDWSWVEYEEGKVIDPYKLLPEMFKDISEKDFNLISEIYEVRNGGAALMAYARMQFEEMSEYERLEITKALLQYCELDTMAMVMIYEGWKDMLKLNK